MCLSTGAEAEEPRNHARSFAKSSGDSALICCSIDSTLHVFAAFGALHRYGARGVPRLLETQGFTVRRLY